MRFKVFETASDNSSVYPQGVLRTGVPYLLKNDTNELVECFCVQAPAEIVPPGVSPATEQKPILFLPKRSMKLLGLTLGDKIRRPILQERCIACSFMIVVQMPEKYLNFETFGAVGELTSFQDVCKNKIHLPRFCSKNLISYTETITHGSSTFDIKVVIGPMISNIEGIECYARSSFYRPDVSDVWKFCSSQQPTSPVLAFSEPATPDSVRKFLGVHSGFQMDNPISHINSTLFV